METSFWRFVCKACGHIASEMTHTRKCPVPGCSSTAQLTFICGICWLTTGKWKICCSSRAGKHKKQHYEETLSISSSDIKRFDDSLSEFLKSMQSQGARPLLQAHHSDLAASVATVDTENDSAPNLFQVDSTTRSRTSKSDSKRRWNFVEHDGNHKRPRIGDIVHPALLEVAQSERLASVFEEHANNAMYEDTSSVLTDGTSGNDAQALAEVAVLDKGTDDPTNLSSVLSEQVGRHYTPLGSSPIVCQEEEQQKPMVALMLDIVSHQRPPIVAMCYPQNVVEGYLPVVTLVYYKHKLLTTDSVNTLEHILEFPPEKCGKDASNSVYIGTRPIRRQLCSDSQSYGAQIQLMLPLWLQSSTANVRAIMSDTEWDTGVKIRWIPPPSPHDLCAEVNDVVELGYLKVLLNDLPTLHGYVHINRLLRRYTMANSLSKQEQAAVIFSAVWHGNEKLLRTALAQCSECINLPNRLGNTPLHAAALRGNMKAVEMLLEDGANPAILNHQGYAPYHYAQVAYQDDIAVRLAEAVLGIRERNADNSENSNDIAQLITAMKRTVVADTPKLEDTAMSIDTPNRIDTPKSVEDHQTETTNQSRIQSTYLAIGTVYPLKRGDISFREITLGALIAHGSCAAVYKGSWRGMEVAIKFLHETDSEELQIMQQLRRHINVVELYGVCFDLPNDERIPKGTCCCLIMPYFPLGSLRRVLDRQTKMGRSLTQYESLVLLLDIAKGMAHLHAEGVIHRDLAARNVLVQEVTRSEEGVHMLAKVGDFDRSRNASWCKAQTTTFNPFWTAPEGLINAEFTPKSDVWSFGMVIWEVITTSQTPWPGQFPKISLQLLSGDGVIEHHPPPETWKGHPLVEIMHQCWRLEPTQRPTFNTLVDILSVLVDCQPMLEQSERQHTPGKSDQGN